MPAIASIARDWLDAGIAIGIAAALALGLQWTLHRFLPKASNSVAFKPIRGLVTGSIILIGLGIASRQLPYVVDNPTVSTWVGRGLAFAWVALAVLTAVRIVNAFFLLRERAQLDPQLRDQNILFRKLVTGFVVIIGLISAMHIGGLDVSPLLAGGAIGGVIIGLALQDSLSNVFAGVLLTIDSNIRVGEMLRFADGRTATLESVGWRSSSFRLLDQTVLVVPNSELSKDRFVNLSRPTLVTTVSIDCGIAYGETLQHVEDIALEVAKAVQSSFGGENLAEPVLRWKEFADSSVNFRLFMPIPNPDVQFMASSDLLKAIHARFAQENINIPFPIRTVYTQSADEDGG